MRCNFLSVLDNDCMYIHTEEYSVPRVNLEEAIGGDLGAVENTHAAIVFFLSWFYCQSVYLDGINLCAGRHRY